MYDLDGDDKISKEELLAVLTMMVGANISQDQLDSIAERTVMEADVDQVCDCIALIKQGHRYPRGPLSTLYFDILGVSITVRTV